MIAFCQSGFLGDRCRIRLFCKIYPLGPNFISFVCHSNRLLPVLADVRQMGAGFCPTPTCTMPRSDYLLLTSALYSKFHILHLAFFRGHNGLAMGRSKMLEPGMKAPSFTLPTDNGTFNSTDHHGKKMVVFFFPRADTSGCTKEAIAFSELEAQFAAANCIVIGISKDTPAKQAKFRAKHGLTCLLGADDAGDVCETFGVWVEKSMYGKSYMGIQRATIVIDEQGMVAAVWPKVKVPGHAEDVLAHVTAA